MAGTNSFENSHFAATLYLRTAFIPVSLGYSRRSSVDEWVVPGLPKPLGRSDAGQGWKLLAQGSKTRVVVERTSYNDRTNGSDFSLLSAGLDHSLRWGKGSTLGSSVETQDRQMTDAHTRRRLSEALHLQHRRNLSSDYSFMFQSRWAPGGDRMRSRSIGTGVNYRPRSWLGLSGAASSQSNDWTSGRTAFSTLTPRLDVRAALPWGATFSGDAGMGYERRTEEAVGDGGAPIADEAHAVGTTRSFFLEHFDVDASSVVIRRADQTLVYQPGIDYRLVPAGVRLQVEVLPGGRIAEGETVLVSYRYQLQPSSDARALLATFRATITIAGLQLTHHRSLRSLLGVEDSLGLAVGELRESFTQVGGGRWTPVGRLYLSASHRSLRSHSADYTTYEFGGTLAPPSTAKLQSNIGGSVARAITGDRRRTTWALRSSAVWTAGRGLRLEGGLETWTWQPDRGPAERYVSASVGLNGTFGAWGGELRYQYQRRVATVGGADNRLSARMLRRL